MTFVCQNIIGKFQVVDHKSGVTLGQANIKVFNHFFDFEDNSIYSKTWLVIANLKPLSLFISLLLMLKKTFGNVNLEKRKVKVVLAITSQPL